MSDVRMNDNVDVYRDTYRDRGKLIERLVLACETYLALHGRRKGVSEGEAKAAYKELLEALEVARTVARG